MEMCVPIPDYWQAYCGIAPHGTGLGGGLASWRWVPWLLSEGHVFMVCVLGGCPFLVAVLVAVHRQPVGMSIRSLLCAAAGS